MDESPQFIRIEIPASTHYLVLVRQFISSLAHEIGFMSGDVAKIELALDEACSNSIRAIREVEGDCPRTRLQLQVETDKRRLAITVRDNGNDFSHHFNSEIALDDLVGNMRTSGYGLRIIKTCMDEVLYEHQPGLGNLLRLVKYVGRSCQELG
jgi:anti-sigma regulatory factor (Ser/Thr protein kinase)